jgi:thiosulfate/3-mercaptopyruvate sulfurtransferase
MQSTFKQLISVEQLNVLISNQIDNQELVILDASIPAVGGKKTAPQAWPNTTISHAKRFDIKGEFSDLSNPLSHTMPNEAQFELAARNLGINHNSQIVIYDDIGIYSAPRAWWMFKAMGFHHVAVLDGGLPAWLAQNYETFVAPSNISIEKGNFIAQFNQDYFCDQQQVLAAINKQGIKTLDARSANRFSGVTSEPRVGIRSGHIPQSFNLPYAQLSVNGDFLSNNELLKIFSSIAQLEDKLIFSCGSGITACILALAADVCGYQHLSVYDGSWSEWGKDITLPIETD